jgi:hypothetical protein
MTKQLFSVKDAEHLLAVHAVATSGSRTSYGLTQLELAKGQFSVVDANVAFIGGRTSIEVVVVKDKTPIIEFVEDLMTAAKQAKLDLFVAGPEKDGKREIDINPEILFTRGNANTKGYTVIVGKARN